MVIEVEKGKHPLNQVGGNVSKTNNVGSRNDSEVIREIASRLAIYRKLKALGHSDETILTVYKKSSKEN